mgnify:CR=1 FL=1
MRTIKKKALECADIIGGAFAPTCVGVPSTVLEKGFAIFSKDNRCSDWHHESGDRESVGLEDIEVRIHRLAF